MAGSLDKLAVRLLEQRRRTRYEQAHVATLLATELRHRQQTRVKGRHSHENARARHEPHDLGSVESRQEQHGRGIEQRAVAGDEKPVGVKQRQRVQQHVARAESPHLVESDGVRAEIVVAERCALGLTGCPRGVQDRGDVVPTADYGLEAIVRLRSLDEAAIARLSERHRARHTAAPGKPTDHVHILGSANDHARLRVAEEMLELALWIARVQRQINEARAQAAEIKAQRLGRFVHLHRDAVTGARAEREQAICKTRGLPLHVGIGQLLSIGGLDGGRVQTPGEAPAQQRVEIGVCFLAHGL